MKLRPGKLHGFLLWAVSTMFVLSVDASTVLVGWTFPETNLVASAGIDINTNQVISVEGGAEIVGFISGNPTSTDAVNAGMWDDGEGTKYWLISLSTSGYTNITLSSEQRGSDTGPRDFRVEYRVGDGVWVEVPDTTMELSSGSWIPGRLTHVLMPEDADDKDVISIRWIMTSNSSIAGQTVAAGGRSRIDNIFVRGEMMPLPAPVVPQVRPATGVQPNQFVANWEAVTGNVAGYELEVATTDQFLRAGETVLVDFEGEGETKGNYNQDTRELSGLEWGFTQAMIGSTVSDWKEGERSLRLGGHEESAFTLLEDLPDGLSKVSFMYRRFSDDNQKGWKVEYSVDQGNSWTQIGNDFTAPDSDDVETFSENVSVVDPVRMRIVRSEMDGHDSNDRRLNIDNIELLPFSTEDEVVEGYDPFNTTQTRAVVEGLDPELVYYYRVRTVGQDDTRSDWSEVQRAVSQPTVIILF